MSERNDDHLEDCVDTTDCPNCSGEGGWNSCMEDTCCAIGGEEGCEDPACWRICSRCRGNGYVYLAPTSDEG